MPIVHLGDATDHAKPGFAGTIYSHGRENYFVRDENNEVIKGEFQGPCVTFTYESHHGLCISEYERNGRDDSDFFMVIWNPETKKAEEYMFATTRGWSYPCLASKPDATPETMAAYKAYTAYQSRRRTICAKWAKRCEAVRLARTNGFRHNVLLTLAKRYDSENYKAICKLLNTNVRSGFRKSLKAQLINWLNDPAPKYDKPFSPKQMQYV